MAQVAQPPRTRRDVVFVHALDLPETISSYRYMSIIPAQEIGARFLRIEPGESPDAFLDRIGGEVLVFGKPFEDDRVTAACERAKARGLKTISWHCDAPTAPGTLERLKRHSAASDAIVAQTAPMAAMIEALIGRRAHIIEECLEYSPSRAHFQPGRDPVQLLWYGHLNNFDTLPEMLKSLARGVGANISLLMLSSAPAPDAVQAQLAGLRGPPFEAAWAMWSRQIQLQAMRSCDIVLAPSLDAPVKQVKGHNRVSEALNQGCVVVAHPLPQYAEFADFVFLERDMSEGVRRALADPEKALARAQAGAEAVRARFAPAAVARKWLALIERVAQS
jgi:glycosyltransferase involved in cell wall biosynthesis